MLGKLSSESNTGDRVENADYASHSFQLIRVLYETCDRDNDVHRDAMARWETTPNPIALTWEPLQIAQFCCVGVESYTHEPVSSHFRTF